MPRGPTEAPSSDAVGLKDLKVMEAASRSALLVRCGGRSSAGLLLDGGLDGGLDDGLDDGLGGGAWRGAFVLAPGLLLFGVDVEDVTDVARTAVRVPPLSVVVRRGRAKPAAISTIAPGAGCAVTSVVTSAAAKACGQQRSQPPHPDDLAEVPAKLVAAWRWPALAKALPHVLAELRVEAEDDKQADKLADKLASRQVRDLLSVFVVLQLQPGAADAASLGDALRRAYRRVPAVPPRGTAVLTASAPLGAAALLGAVCRGVVAGTAPGGLLTLTDARVAPGGEGAGVFAQDAADALPFAVVFSPLTWWRGEAVGFTLCVGLRCLLQDALRHLPGHRGQPDVPLAEEADQCGLDRSVLLVRCAHMWGSGVVVDKEKRVVLTCAHVLAEDEPVSVFWGGHSVKASVLWRSADGVPYDVAVLQLADDACVAELEALALDTRPPRVGEPVLAVGYPLFSERCAVPAEALSEHRVVRPLVSRGEVSGWWRSSSSQILSTCCVQSGASGGPLLRLGPTGPTAIGVLVCNAQLGCGRDAVVYPHVNFALWADTVAGPINEFLASGDAAVLAGLQCDSPSVQRQWKLQPPKMCKL